jgi:hypothetical protein
VAVRDALRIARQIAGALEAAHDRGIAFSNLASRSDRAYDMMPDGRRFPSLTDPLLSEAGLGSMTIVLDWFEELKARAPAGR